MTERFTFFYGGMASNWHPVRFEVDKVTYNCVEQFMMASKAILFKDFDALEIIMEATSPKIQKAAGRLVKGFDTTVWQANAKPIVYRGCMAKYTQNSSEREWLLDTNGTTLVEASPWDKIWGIGLEASDSRAQSRDTWLGTNWLGEIETEVRTDIITMMDFVTFNYA